MRVIKFLTGYFKFPCEKYPSKKWNLKNLTLIVIPIQISRKSDLPEEEKEDCPNTKKMNSPSTSSSPEQESPETKSDTKDEIEKYWDELETGGEIKDLLGSKIVKNKNRMRFQVKTISLKEEET